jgi:hypothetical protein
MDGRCVPISADQIKRGIEIAGLFAAQLPNALDLLGRYHLQIFQPGIVHGHEWVIAFPIIIAIAGFSIILRSTNALICLLPAALAAALIAGGIWEWERQTHALDIYVLLLGWVAWSTFLGLAALGVADLIKAVV